MTAISLASHPADGRNVFSDAVTVHGFLNGCRVSGQEVIQYIQSLGIDVASDAGLMRTGFSGAHISSVSRLVRRRVAAHSRRAEGSSGLAPILTTTHWPGSTCLTASWTVCLRTFWVSSRLFSAVVETTMPWEGI